jgi:hypothetical protein
MGIGAPPWARRLKRIEDLSALIAKMVTLGRRVEAEARFAEVLKLIDDHNRYYPIEANLPFDPITSRLIDHGEPWKPMAKPTFESLIAEQRPR